jgi:hypothetical protein
MSAIAPLFDEAWEHRRRRRRRLFAIALMCLVGGLATTALLTRGALGPSATTHRGPVRVTPGRVLSETPYMGVSCPVANSIACNRVGLAVWLKRPAVSVTATIAGGSFALDYRGDLESSSHRPRLEFAGFLTRAGIMSRVDV